MIDQVLGAHVIDDSRVYTPVLRAKASEWKALGALTPAVRQRIVPVIEFMPDWKQPGAVTTSRKKRAPQTAAEYVQRFLESAIEATPPGTRSFVDFGHAGKDGMWNGIDLWAEFESVVPRQTRIVPLVDLGAVGRSLSLARLTPLCGEIGLRLGVTAVSPALGNAIGGALRTLGVSQSQTHIIADLKAAPTAVSHSQLRAALGGARSFVSVVALSGVFPRDLTQYQPGVALEPRREWQTWWRERMSTASGERLVSFGDYTTQCAVYEPSPEVPGSVSLRYTTDDAILVFRGRQSNSSTGLGHDQMHGHCRLLVTRADYDGPAFSEGDRRMSCWTDPANGTGNAMQWRTAAMVHHITHVVVQLQDAAGSSLSVRSWARGQVPPRCR